MENTNKKYRYLLLVFIILNIFFILYGTFNCVKVVMYEKNKEPYIQNLEEKLNIYETKYEEFCLEDSIRQVE